MKTRPFSIVKWPKQRRKVANCNALTLAQQKMLGVLVKQPNKQNKTNKHKNMNNQTALEKPKPQVSPLIALAQRMQVDPNKLLETLKATVFQKASNEELLALCSVANSYGLNPLLKEIYAFPGKNGGIVPMVPIDGWTRIINRQENLNGFKFVWEFGADGLPVSCTCIMFVKGREHPVEVTEYYRECYRKTEPWDKMPCRMMRHKALMQSGRYAFGFSGIYDEDEALDQALTMHIPTTRTLQKVTVTTPAPAAEQASEAKPEPANQARPPQAELAAMIIEAGHSFDDFAAWGKEMFPNMPWDNITCFDEVPMQDAKRFQRAHVGLLKALANAKGVTA